MAELLVGLTVDQHSVIKLALQQLIIEFETKSDGNADTQKRIQGMHEAMKALCDLTWIADQPAGLAIIRNEPHCHHVTFRDELIGIVYVVKRDDVAIWRAADAHDRFFLTELYATPEIAAKALFDASEAWKKSNVNGLRAMTAFIRGMARGLKERATRPNIIDDGDDGSGLDDQADAFEAGLDQRLPDGWKPYIDMIRNS